MTIFFNDKDLSKKKPILPIRERDRDRQRQTETDRQTDRQTETDRQRARAACSVGASVPGPNWQS